MIVHGVVVALTALTAVIAALAARRVARRGRSALTGPLVVVLVSIAWWSAMSVVAGLAPSAAVRLAAFYGVLVGAGSLVAGALWFSLVFTGRGDGPGARRAVALVGLEPVVLVALALVPSTRHGLATYRGPVVSGPAQIEFGPLFYLHTAFSYLVLGAAAVLLLRSLRAAVPGQQPLLLVSLGVMSVPLAANVLSVFVLIDRGMVDLAAVCELGVALVWWQAGERAGMFDLPLSTEQVLDAMGDGVLVLDPAGRVLRANVVARGLLGEISPGVGLDHLAGGVFAGTSGELAPLPDGRLVEVRERTVGLAETRGRIMVLRDVTDRERLRAELAEQTVRDGLTGLHNRRHLRGALDGCVARARAADEPLAALMVDVDHFKYVNDTYGHAAGDRVLVALADVLAAMMRAGDVLVRFGGEEFLVLLPGTDLAGAQRVAERVRTRVGAMPAPDGGPAGLRLTASVGVAVLGPDPDALLRDADRALYRAKAQGRDRVVVAEPSWVAS